MREAGSFYIRLQRAGGNADDDGISWDVGTPRDYGVGADDGTLANLDGGDEDRAGADLGIGADGRFPFCRTVEIGGDRGRADVDVSANLGVSEVREVASTSPLGEMRPADFHERSELDAIVENSPLADVSERAYAAALADKHVAEYRGERKNYSVATDDGAAVDVGISWVDDAYPLAHPVVLDPTLHDGVGLSEMLASIDAQDVVGLQDR